jgi:uncharacterized membrane protein YciS (DUF1049 family)
MAGVLYTPNERENMKYLIFIVSIIAVFVIIAGCTTENNTIPVIENKLSTLNPSEMALQLSDLP